MKKLSRFLVNLGFGIIGLFISIASAYRVLYLGDILGMNLASLLFIIYFTILGTIAFYRFSTKHSVNIFSFIFIILSFAIVYGISYILDEIYPIFIISILAFVISRLSSKLNIKSSSFLLGITIGGYVIGVSLGIFIFFLFELLINIGKFLFGFGILFKVLSIIPFALLVLLVIGIQFFSLVITSED